MTIRFPRRTWRPFGVPASKPHDRAGPSRARLGEPVPAGVAAGFHSVTITEGAVPYIVLCHAHLPVVSFADTPLVPRRPVSGFVDPPLWTGAFETAGLRMLSADELSTPMTQVDLSELSAAELTQIRYWRPRVLSDLLFNWWD